MPAVYNFGGFWLLTIIAVLQNPNVWFFSFGRFREPHPRAPRARAARARPRHPTPHGAPQAQGRGGGQHRRIADRADSYWTGATLPGSGTYDIRPGAQAGRDRRSRDRRIGQSPGSDGTVGPPGQG